MAAEVFKEEIEEDILELAQRYLAKIGPQAEEANSACCLKDYDSAHKIAHSLKGTSGSYGFIGLYELAVKLETAVEEKAWVMAKDIVADIQHYHLNVKIIPIKEV